MADTPKADAEFILGHAERLVKVASMCVISFGLADGLNATLKGSANDESDWQQAALGFRDGTLMMAVLRAHLLLDRDERMVSFQTVHNRLKLKPVQQSLKRSLGRQHGSDGVFGPSRDEQIATFLETYAEINWDVHGRLVHFRNRGLAHLTVESMRKSITFDELRDFISIISRLTIVLQRLCHTPTAFRETMLDDYRGMARKTMARRFAGRKRVVR